MKALFVGGTGIISSAVSVLAVERGIELTLLVRGQSFRPAPEGAEVLTADINDVDGVRRLLGDRSFDVVVEWIGFVPEQVKRDIDLFRERTNQYVFISSASAYQKPPRNLPVRESNPLRNPYWEYSRNKIACEDVLVRSYREDEFPVTIVRPSHTYDRTLLPFEGGWTVVDRMRRGLPVIVHGDGTSLWTMTHHRDFAVGFLGLLGHPNAIGEAFHITSDEWLSWNAIFRSVALASGVKEPRLLHVPSERIAARYPDWGAGLVGDKAHSMILDNSKIKRLVPEYRCAIPFHRGAREILAWYDENPERRIVDPEWNERFDRLVKDFGT